MPTYTPTRVEYNVTTKHPTGYADGVHKITVTTTTIVGDDGDTTRVRRCNADTFGASRDFHDFTAANDAAAIRLWLGEHACTATAIASTSPDTANAFAVGDVCNVTTDLRRIGGPDRVHVCTATVVRITASQVIADTPHGSTLRFRRVDGLQIGHDKLTPTRIEPNTARTVAPPQEAPAATAHTIKADPVGSASCVWGRLDGVEFVTDARATAFGPGFVGWFPSIPSVAFEAATENALRDHARDWFRAQVKSCTKNTAREYPKADTVARVVKGFASSVLRDREGVIAWGPTPTAVRCFAAAWLVCVPAR